MRCGNDDSIARDLWGQAYDAIPKSVFAVVAWYLADCASDEGVGNGGELRRFIEELEAMGSNGILDERQVKKALRSVARPEQGETK